MSKFSQKLTFFAGNDKDKLEEANVVVSTSFGASASRKEVSEIWPYLPNLKWMAVLSAGITQVLADELVQSDVTLTNAKVSPSI